MFFAGKPKPLRAGRVTESDPVPAHIERPGYARGEAVHQDPGGPRDAATIDRMRRAGRMSRTILERVAAEVAPGVTTDELDRLAQRLVIEAGGYPSTLGYPVGELVFHKALCTSVNEVACHGIPDDRPLERGDVISLDLTVYLDGVHGDTCLTVPVGIVDGRTTQLIAAADASLAAGIAAVRPGAQIREIGIACDRVARERGFAIVSTFTGHGIGTGFHAPPRYVQHVDDPSATELLVPGMTLTIEPILTAGRPDIAFWDDGWTAVTRDGSRCTQAEHTVLVTESGVEILTVAEHD